LLTFTADESASLGGPDWLTKCRGAAWERFSAARLPTESEDLWKYSEVDSLDLGSFSPRPQVEISGPVVAGLVDRARKLADRAGERLALAVTLDGRLILVEDGSDAARVHGAHGDDGGHESVVTVRDAFDELHSAFVADIVEIEIAPKADVELPVVVVHLLSPRSWLTEETVAPASFPHLRVVVGTSGSGRVVEILAGASDVPHADDAHEDTVSGLVLPVAELDVRDDARLSYALFQSLPYGWRQLAVQSGRVGRDGTLRSFCASLGASRARVRADAELVGQGAEAVLVAGYLGTGTQLHDLRTVQDHIAPKTRSQLLCMGAVTDVARSAYVGLTRVRNGAHGADAFQTNRNLVLSEGAHADSVPNLDIEENDVRCSHASTVGPIDEDQLYYLESRGIEPEVAERLIVLGFFKNLTTGVPIKPVGEWFVSSVAERLGLEATTRG
jgi:Fe-S cluster assembly protein SufD